MEQIEEIVDSEALAKYNELKEHDVLNEYRKFQTSNPHLEVDVAASLYQLRKKCSEYNIKKSELRYIETRHQLFVIFSNRLTGYKRQAFGITGKNALPERERILDPRKAELIELFGKFHSVSEVHKIVNQDWGIDISVNAVKDFRGKHIEQIKERQESYKQDFSNVRLGHKRSRLDEFSWLYDNTKERFERTRDRNDMKFMKDLLESIKKEVDGNVVTIQGDIKATIEHTLDVHINQEILPQLSINEIIISRVAGRLGVNPLFLLWKLSNSMYSQFTGINPADGFDPYEENPIYPSSMVYDLAKLKSQNKEREVEDAEILEEVNSEKEMTDEQKTEAEKIKDALRKRLREVQQEKEASEKRIDRVSE